MRSAAFRGYVAHFVFRLCQRADAHMVREFIEILDGEALFGGLQRDVSVRFARTSDGAFLDLGDGTQAVETTSSGWGLVTDPPIDFVQTAGMISLPLPVESADGKPIRWFDLGIGQEDTSLILLWSAIVAAGFPVPILRVTGEEPAAPARVIRGILDPHRIPIRAVPQTAHDLFLHASSTGLVVLGPERKLTQSQENAMLKLASGIAFAKKAAYSDYEEAVFQGARPIIFSYARELQVSLHLEAKSICVGADRRQGSARRMEEMLQRSHAEILASILGAAIFARFHLDAGIGDAVHSAG